MKKEPKKTIIGEIKDYFKKSPNFPAPTPAKAAAPAKKKAATATPAKKPTKAPVVAKPVAKAPLKAQDGDGRAKAGPAYDKAKAKAAKDKMAARNKKAGYKVNE